MVDIKPELRKYWMRSLNNFLWITTYNWGIQWPMSQWHSWWHDQRVALRGFRGIRTWKKKKRCGYLQHHHLSPHRIAGQHVSIFKKNKSAELQTSCWHMEKHDSWQYFSLLTSPGCQSLYRKTWLNYRAKRSDTMGIFPKYSWRLDLPAQ